MCRDYRFHYTGSPRVPRHCEAALRVFCARLAGSPQCLSLPVLFQTWLQADAQASLARAESAEKVRLDGTVWMAAQQGGVVYVLVVQAPEGMLSFHAPPQELALLKEAAAQAQGELERSERKCQAAAAEAQASSDAAARMRVRLGWEQG